MLRARCRRFNFAAVILSPEYREYLLVSKARPVNPDVEDMVV